eukprot:scaffold1746_cov121-Isochrysis_galbana.AAC.5
MRDSLARRRDIHRPRGDLVWLHQMPCAVVQKSARHPSPSQRDTRLARVPLPSARPVPSESATRSKESCERTASARVGTRFTVGRPSSARAGRVHRSIFGLCVGLPALLCTLKLHLGAQLRRPERDALVMTSEGSTTASSAYGKEVFMSTFREASKKINCQTIKERGGESLQLVKEKLMAIDWPDVQSQMKDFNLEIFQPYRQVRSCALAYPSGADVRHHRRPQILVRYTSFCPKRGRPRSVPLRANMVGFKAYLRSTFTLEGPQQRPSPQLASALGPEDAEFACRPQVENDLDGFNQYNSLCFWWGAFEALLSLLFMNFLAPLVILGGYLAAMVRLRPSALAVPQLVAWPAVAT